MVAWPNQGTTLPLSLVQSTLPPQESFPQGWARGMSGWAPALGLRRGNRPQEEGKEGSLGYVLISSWVGICSGYSRIVHS